MERDLAIALINAGVGAIVAVLILVGLYRLAGSLGGRFIEAQKAQAEALGRQAQSMEQLTASLRHYIARDTGEHREMLTLLRYVAQKLQNREEICEGNHGGQE